MVFTRYLLVEWPLFFLPLFFLIKVTAMNLSELEMESITGEAVSFSEYRDQALLIVNLASQ